MAIIINDRNARQEPEQRAAEEPEVEVDYRWHPTEEEFVSPITAEQWAELLGDADFAESDAARAVRCLCEYGEPATFQQLSIRYRGTMGRYRRWLSEAAQAAGERYGVPAPQQDQFGMDEWWPLLYQTRVTGKIGAGVFEMLLRPEVTEAFEIMAEKERQAKRAENVRNLKRIEQLERARQEERERRAKAAAAAAELAAARVPEPEPKPQPESEPEQERPAEKRPKPAARPKQAASAPAQQPKAEEAPSEEAAAAVADQQPKLQTVIEMTPDAPAATTDEDLPEVRAFLAAMAHEAKRGGNDAAVGSFAGDVPTIDLATPVDYALRYAERLRGVLALMQAGVWRLSAATVARELEDESVERFQGVLNGQGIPSFAYLDVLHERMFVNLEHLEVPDGLEEGVPSFCALDEMVDEQGVVSMLLEGGPTQIAYVVDDSKDRRSGVVVRFSALRCALLTRRPVAGAAKRSRVRELDAYMRMTDELDVFARSRGIERTNHQITAADWDALAAGSMWPGALLA